jgi:hypothetical protein
MIARQTGLINLEYRGDFMKTVGIYISLVVGLLLNSSASYADGNTLLQRCSVVEKFTDGKTTDDELGAGVCLGLVKGINLTLTFIREISGNEAAINTCIPESVNNGQAVRVVLAYLRANPATLHLDEVVLIILALQEAFPCD